MTPQAKALELKQKYLNLQIHGLSTIHATERATRCALVCVEEIIAELEQLRKPEYTTFVTRYASSEDDKGDVMDGYEKIDYWTEVKTELEKTNP